MTTTATNFSDLAQNLMKLMSENEDITYIAAAAVIIIAGVAVGVAVNKKAKKRAQLQEIVTLLTQHVEKNIRERLNSAQSEDELKQIYEEEAEALSEQIKTLFGKNPPRSVIASGLGNFALRSKNVINNERGGIFFRRARVQSKTPFEVELDRLAEERRRDLQAQAEAERQRLAVEAEAQAEAERQRLATEAEAVAEAERQRLAAEAEAAVETAAEAERQRLAAEAEAAAEAAAEAERQRLALVKEAREELDRKAEMQDALEAATPVVLPRQTPQHIRDKMNQIKEATTQAELSRLVVEISRLLEKRISGISAAMQEKIKAALLKEANLARMRIEARELGIKTREEEKRELAIANQIADEAREFTYVDNSEDLQKNHGALIVKIRNSKTQGTIDDDLTVQLTNFVNARYEEALGRIKVIEADIAQAEALARQETAALEEIARQEAAAWEERKRELAQEETEIARQKEAAYQETQEAREKMRDAEKKRKRQSEKKDVEGLIGELRNSVNLLTADTDLGKLSGEVEALRELALTAIDGSSIVPEIKQQLIIQVNQAYKAAVDQIVQAETAKVRGWLDELLSFDTARQVYVNKRDLRQTVEETYAIALADIQGSALLNPFEKSTLTTEAQEAYRRAMEKIRAETTVYSGESLGMLKDSIPPEIRERLAQIQREGSQIEEKMSQMIASYAEGEDLDGLAAKLTDSLQDGEGSVVVDNAFLTTADALIEVMLNEGLVSGPEKQALEELNQQLDAALERTSSPSTVADMLDTPYGGIDFNPELLDLQIIRDSHGTPLPLNFQSPGGMQNIKGFFPIIQEILPIQSLPLFLGAAAEDERKKPFDTAHNNVFIDIFVDPKFIDKSRRANHWLPPVLPS